MRVFTNTNRKSITQWTKERKDRINALRRSNRSLSYNNGRSLSNRSLRSVNDDDDDDDYNVDDHVANITKPSLPIHEMSSYNSEGNFSTLVIESIDTNESFDSAASTETTIRKANETVPSFENRSPLRIMFLSANTGGGHRASAESLINQVYLHYPGSTCEIFDLEQVMNIWPHTILAGSYNKMTERPNNWKMFYHLTNTHFATRVADIYSKVRCEKSYVNVIRQFNPDVIISVHPFLNHVPLSAARKAGDNMHKHIPFYTVVTDLGSGHRTWFEKDIDKLYVASEKLRNLAIEQGPTPPDRVALVGLPIRNDFTVIAEELKDRHSPHGKIFQRILKAHRLRLPSDPEKPMILLMGGGEGVGSLWDIVVELYYAFVEESIDATICVVCAKNTKLKRKFQDANWNHVYQTRKSLDFVSDTFKKYFYNQPTNRKPKGKVTVVPLGFIKNMAEYMAAAHLLITKAGPGTIAEAAALGLPIMLTSFLPGQEAGNVDFVLEGGFGSFREKPIDIAQEVARWLKHPQKELIQMSEQARKHGQPDAAREIILDIGSRTHMWRKVNVMDMDLSARTI